MKRLLISRPLLLLTSFLLAPCFLLLSLAATQAAPAPLNSQDAAFFETQIRPLLSQRCYACHSARASRVFGGLMLDSREGVLRGGASGPAIVPGNPDKSLLIKAVRYTGPKMPPTGKLPDSEIAALQQWVKRGAPDPRTGAPTEHKGIDIEKGRKHWAFQPLKPVTPPGVKAAGWGRTPVDQFILAKLEEKGLKPNPPANRRILIRRATFDLLGLPPTPEEVEAFVNDRSPDAYGKLIDRLLASPHYGERWGRHWLDLARFAESHGFEQDYDRPYAYQYRDFVIKALNSDMPYNQFVRWQLAGDEFDPDNPMALAATGFLAAGVHSTQITKNQVEKERYDELDDMLSTTGTAMLGLTVGCARCHDHKYDPIPTRDYYRLLSTFTTTVRSDMEMNVDPEGYRRARAAFDQQHAPLVEALARFEKEQLPQRLEAWLKNPPAGLEHPEWQRPEFASYKSEGGATLTEMEDGSLLASGANPDFDTYTFVVHTQLQGITGFRLEALADPSMVQGGPGRAANGNFALTDFRVIASPLQGSAPPVEVKWKGARATFEQKGLPIAATIDKDPKSAWAVDPQFGKNQAAVFEAETPVGFDGGSTLTFTLKFENNTGHNIGRPRLSLTTMPASQVSLDSPAVPEPVVHALQVERAKAKVNGPISQPVNPSSVTIHQSLISSHQLTGSPIGSMPHLAINTATPILQNTQTPRYSNSLAATVDYAPMLKWYRTMDPEWQKLDQKVQDHLAQAPKPVTEKALICSEGVQAIRLHTQGEDFFPQTYFLKRGDPSQKLGVADQGFLQVLMKFPETHWQEQPPQGWRTSYRRRSLANWITDTDSGAGQLLARVIVNRLWQHHLGQGIVATPSDFGNQGEPPTHPELLEWLAAEFVKPTGKAEGDGANGSTGQPVSEAVGHALTHSLTATLTSTHPDTHITPHDPYACGWSLKALHRLIMTSAVYIQSASASPQAARVDPENRLFSRSRRQRLEAEAVRDAMLSISGMLDPAMFGPGSLDEKQKRRSIYFTIKRSQLIPSMRLFDAPDALQSIANRGTTTVAPQALMLMNNENVQDWAHHLSHRIAPALGTPGFSLKNPDFNLSIEKAIQSGYLLALSRPPTKEEIRDSLDFVKQQAQSYEQSGAKNVEEAALSDFCQVLLSLNEFIYIE